MTPPMADPEFGGLVPFVVEWGADSPHPAGAWKPRETNDLGPEDERGSQHRLCQNRAGRSPEFSQKITQGQCRVARRPGMASLDK